MKVLAHYYQQFDADYSLDVPAEGFGGWKSGEVELSDENTAVVIMHAWDVGPQSDCPGLWRHVEYIPRANRIVTEVFPALLAGARKAGVPVIHVVGYGEYFQHMAGFKKAVEIAGPEVKREHLSKYVPADPAILRLREFRAEHVGMGRHNEADLKNRTHKTGFPVEAMPLESEFVCETTHQLFKVCAHLKVNHLIYAGFAVNWCLLMEQGGMIDMQRRGLMCSVVRDAVTAVENKETARGELNKQEGLWRVALRYGLVFDSADLVKGFGTKV
jgi:nicotinamidase-related amidase